MSACQELWPLEQLLELSSTPPTLPFPPPPPPVVKTNKHDPLTITECVFNTYKHYSISCIIHQNNL